MYIDDVQLDVFAAPPRFFVLTDGGPLNIPTAVEVSNIRLPDNGMTLHCQVADCPKDGSPCIGLGINSTIANLVVAGKTDLSLSLTHSPFPYLHSLSSLILVLCVTITITCMFSQL